jgi:putative toxin-antitoxin system antitoxin component (TIGR02293 family)
VAKPAVAAARESADVVAFRNLIRERRGGPNLYARLLGLQPQETLALLEQVEAGLSYRAFERFQKSAELSTQELATLVQIKPRTLMRRRAEGKLSAEESDRLLRASRVFGGALALFEGDLAAARAWFGSPAPALGGRSPREVAASDVGAREVESLIGRLEHGAFS